MTGLNWRSTELSRPSSLPKAFLFLFFFTTLEPGEKRTVRSFMKDRESRGKTCLKLAQWLVWQPLVTLGVISPWIDLNYCLKMQLLTVPTKACHWRCLLNYKSQQDITADLCVCVAWRWAPSFVCSSRWQGLWFVSHSWAWGRLFSGQLWMLNLPCADTGSINRWRTLGFCKKVVRALSDKSQERNPLWLSQASAPVAFFLFVCLLRVTQG